MAQSLTTVTRPEFGDGRTALLRAAIRVVGQGGLRQMTYRAVAAEAGVTHGLVAHHFGSRETLMLEALKFSAEESIAASSLLAHTGDLDEYLSGLAEMVASDPDAQVFQYELLLESRRNANLRPLADELLRMYREAARAGLRQLGFDDPDFSDLVYAALDGLVFQQVTNGDQASTQRHLRTLRRVLARLIEA
ncbi:MAG: TetR family transcriptional regulator [Aeromicrobium sp.]